MSFWIWEFIPINLVYSAVMIDKHKGVTIVNDTDFIFYVGYPDLALINLKKEFCQFFTPKIWMF